MAVNKVVYGGRTVMDVTGDTVTPETLAEGTTATNAAGEKILGTMKAGGGGKRTCRFVIGTSIAGWTEADCDYLCDGTADDVEINAAIQALPESGGEIRILDGIYQITETIVVNKPNVNIEGNGAATVLSARPQKSLSSQFIMMRCQKDCFSMTKIKFFVKDISIHTMFQAFNSGGEIQGIKIKDCIFEGYTTELCIALNAINSIVEGCGLDDCPNVASIGLFVTTKNNNIIKNNYGIHTAQGYQSTNICSLGTHNQFIGNCGLNIAMRGTCDSIIKSNIGDISLERGTSTALGGNKNNIIIGNVMQLSDGTYSTLNTMYLSNSIVSGNIVKRIATDDVERNNIISDNILMPTQTE